MFNQAGFNELPFNVPFNVWVTASFVIDHSNELEARLSMTYTLKFDIDHSLDIDFAGIRDRVGAFVIDQASEMVFSAVRDRIGKFTIDSELTMSFSGGRYRVESVSIAGPIAPGDELIIDSRKKLVTLNGQIIGYEGDFFDLHPGRNNLTYIDPNTGRTVLCRITYRDRYL